MKKEGFLYATFFRKKLLKKASLKTFGIWDSAKKGILTVAKAFEATSRVKDGLVQSCQRFGFRSVIASVRNGIKVSFPVAGRQGQCLGF
ncbi:hypothetical protein C5749_12040 [Sphingobacterium gobiense]|uniref:Uncharacterized protein n=1 Tax=Sphingobacterium gobiense TaxID=1382456 RepID=A0A2S9JM71_9SPHI|nr:hypothetical protein C5749_12040 [Sphingobacterium gobiense]